MRCFPQLLLFRPPPLLPPLLAGGRRARRKGASFGLSSRGEKDMVEFIRLLIGDPHRLLPEYENVDFIRLNRIGLDRKRTTSISPSSSSRSLRFTTRSCDLTDEGCIEVDVRKSVLVSYMATSLRTNETAMMFAANGMRRFQTRALHPYTTHDHLSGTPSHQKSLETLL
ncbi:hypothetical protein OPV22_025471 [Ensete ventricosum]|uniref:Uncharacterized protein n=1 Tax=Ensete ventricosum TaxID=4639 RepID=A0AAV8QJJ5_ENSVE|nr:hypothetical protein OPV22_025471 [Ensete ventricosum]